VILPIPAHQVLVRAFLFAIGRAISLQHKLADQRSITHLKLEKAMEAATNKLKHTRLFAHLPDTAIIQLVERPGVMIGSPGMPVQARQGDLVVLLEGGLVMSSEDGEYRAAFTVATGTREPAILYTIPANARLELLQRSIYVVIDGEDFDNVLSAKQEANSLAALDDKVRRRVANLLGASAFKKMPFEHLCRCAAVMQSIRVEAGERVVRQGNDGEFFYVLESGSAEVWRNNPTNDHVRKLATLGPGDTFGEEALLNGGRRNATVRMTRDGSVLRIGKADFDRLLSRQLLHEVGMPEARHRLAQNKASLIDCRSEEEWELWRLKNSRLVPLDAIRERSRGFDKKREYIVYCRSGRRSRVAAFLMRQAGLNALSLKGGIATWPYELEGRALQPQASSS
jgi:rhodanese-related sulfurtransferase